MHQNTPPPLMWEGKLTTQPMGIDVSNHQGPAIDWAQVAGAGIQFAYIKATEGNTFTDKYYTKNHIAARKVGILAGGYHYFRPELLPVPQAAHFCSVIGKLMPGDLQPAVDVEESRGMAPQVVVDRLWAFVQEVQQRTGRNVTLYTYPDFWLHRAANSGEFAHALALWIANYDVPSPWLGRWAIWSFWQYTSTGRCPGVEGNCDMNRFNGTYDQLRKFAGY